MGLVKHLAPKQTRRAAVEYVNEHLPDGFIKNNLANFVTIGGFALVKSGVKKGGKAGAVMRSVGEIADDIDGDIARAFGIDSTLGKYLDVVLDKAKVGLEIGSLWANAGNLPNTERRLRRLALGFIAAKHLANSVLNTTSQLKGQTPESSQRGKINMWVDGVTLAAFAASDVIESESVSRTMSNVGYITAVVGAPLGLATTYGYAQELAQSSMAQTDLAIAH